MSGKWTPNDPRLELKPVTVYGNTYNVYVTKTEGTPKATVLLLHGFPDLPIGWRYQVPMLMSMGLRVLIPNLLGYGSTDAPDDPKEYTMKKMAGDLKSIVANICGHEERVILGGHDWGGGLAWQTARWHPEFISGVFVVCTPYIKPNPKWVELDTIINAGHLQNFGYQVQFAGPEVEKKIDSPEKIGQFLNAMYGGVPKAGAGPGFTPNKGIAFENIDKLKKTRLMSNEEFDHYISEWSRNGMRGPLNWYRTRRMNWENDEEEAIKDTHKFPMPALFVMASKDSVLKPELSVGMEEKFEDLTRSTVDAHHWALWEAPAAVNEAIKGWIEAKSLNGGMKKASL